MHPCLPPPALPVEFRCELIPFGLYQPRLYREEFNHASFHFFPAVFGESDLLIGVEPGMFRKEMVSHADRELKRLHGLLNAHILQFPSFLNSLEPLPEKELPEDAPLEIRTMLRCGAESGTGPMSSVAGLVAEYVGKVLAGQFGLSELLVENGGDLFIKSCSSRVVSIQAGSATLSGTVGLEIHPGTWGVCTSSGTVGHSFSRGSADAVTVVSPSVPLADAWATALANRIGSPDDIGPVLEEAGSVEAIRGCAVLAGGKIGVRGDFELKLLN
jgi:hypothetical protein